MYFNLAMLTANRNINGILYHSANTFNRNNKISFNNSYKI